MQIKTSRFAVDEKRPAQPLLSEEMTDGRIPQAATPVVISGEGRRSPTWLILLIIALVFLILTVVAGYFVLGPGSW